MCRVKRFLSTYVVDFQGVHRQSVVTVDADNHLLSIEPFLQETANTVYVPAIIVIAPSAMPSTLLLDAVSHGDMKATAIAISHRLPPATVHHAVTLYALDITTMKVTEL